MIGKNDEAGPKRASGKPFAPKRSRHKNYGPKAISVVKDILASSAPGLNIDALVRQYMIIKLWPECVGAHLAKNSAPTGLVNKTLNCAVSSSAWMSELNYRKNAIIDKLNSLLKQDAISAVIFRIGPLPAPASAPLKPLPAHELSDNDREFIRKSTEPIKNDALRDAVRRAMTTAMTMPEEK